MRLNDACIKPLPCSLMVIASENSLLEQEMLAEVV